MNERKGTTKRQHYVPRWMLRHFSRDGKRLSLLVDGRRIDDASLGKQCYRDYFYGSDNTLENSFKAEEGRMSAFFGDCDASRFATLDEDTIRRLHLFVIYQHARTAAAAEHLSKFAGAFAKRALKTTAELNPDQELRPEDIDRFEIGLSNTQFESLWVAARTVPILLDMDAKFIVTDRTPGFVISDHPVVSYNQFAEHHPILKLYPVSTGFALKGLQLFVPISPSLVLALFDPMTYEYGGKSRVCRAGPHDVAHLNRMQAVNASECLYFHPDRMNDEALDDLRHVRQRHPSIYEKKVMTSQVRQRSDGKLSQFVAVFHAEVRVGAKLSFIRTIDGHAYEDYEGPTIPVRSPQLVEFAERYGDFLDQQSAGNQAQAAASTTDTPPS